MKLFARLKPLPVWHWFIAAGVAAFAIVAFLTWVTDSIEVSKQRLTGAQIENRRLESEVARIAGALRDLQAQDQVVINKRLQENVDNIEKTYSKTVAVYEDLLRLKEVAKDTKTFDASFADILTMLSKQNYASASANLNSLKSKISEERAKIAAAFTIPANVKESSAPPGSGYSRQSVPTDIGTYLVDIVAADMATTRVIVDTASDGTCARDCPVLSLGDYVARNGAFAGINGSYFCPADYPSCADKKNSFDTLLMNKNKVYFNSENNVYSTVPAVIFQSGSMRFVSRSLEWGRDTGVDGVLANQPLLLSGGSIAFGGSGDPKQGSKGSRSFVGSRGSTAYIGVVRNATVAEVAHVLKALGLDGAINLDSGGSTALWSGGYKAGPGRNIPNAILFVRK